MKGSWAWLCALTPLLAQTPGASETAYVYDVNGRRVPAVWTSSRQAGPGESRTIEHSMSVNGRLVPRQEVVEKVIREDATGRVVERTVIPYDPNGNPGPPAKVRIEEFPDAGGGKRVIETTWRANINGSFQLSERAVTEVRRENGVEKAVTSVARPTLNGTLETFERSEAESYKVKDGTRSRVSIFRPDANGRFRELERQEVETKTSGGETVSNLNQYRVRGSQMVLDGQTVSRTVKRDGSEVTEVDIYRADVPGRPTSLGKPALIERQKIERSQSEGELKEKVVSQLASPNDPGRLEAPRIIAERVCKGKCAP